MKPFLRTMMASLLAFGACGEYTPAADVPPDSYRKLWEDPSLKQRIAEGIEQHRKGDAVLEIVDAEGHPLSEAKVEVRQVRHAFLFGCNAFVLGQLSTPELNRKYEEAFARLFNFATVPFYWGDLEPAEGKPRFAEGSAPIWRRPPPDQVVRWCQAHGITPKGHALMYVKTMFMPAWLDRHNAQMLQTAAEKHLAQIAERYRGDIPIWDVVNEEIPRLRHPDEWHAVPEDYLAWCFGKAAPLFPQKSSLLINDGTDEAHHTPAVYEELVKGLLQRKVRIDGLGMQFHVYNRGAVLKGNLYPPEQLAAVYESFGQLGLPLYITEITVPGSGEGGAALQGEIVANLYRLWFSTPHMAGVTWWNLADGTAFGEENKALGGLLDQDLNPKPAYDALDRLINHEWRTNLTGTTDAAGKTGFRGFYGKYTVTVVSGGRSKQFTMDLLKDDQALHTFKLQL